MPALSLKESKEGVGNDIPNTRCLEVGSVLYKRVCRSVHPYVCSDGFLILDHCLFPNLDMSEIHMKLCVTARFFGKVFFAPKFGKMGQK